MTSPDHLAWSVISLCLQGPPGTMGMMGDDGERGLRVRESYSGIVCLTCHLANPVACLVIIRQIYLNRCLRVQKDLKDQTESLVQREKW